MQPNDILPDQRLGLSHVVIAAFGRPARPGDHLIELQAATGRFIAWITGLRMPRFGARTAHPADRIPTNR